MSEDSESSYKISKYNGAVSQLFRLDELWQDAHRHSRTGNYNMWNADLDKVWSELAGDLKADGTEEKQYNNFTVLLNKTGYTPGIPLKGFSVPTKEDNINRAKYYGVLLQKEIWLRRLQNAQGKGTKHQDESEDDIE